MSSIELYINDEPLDLKVNENIPLTFQTQSITNVVESRGNFSRSFDVPRTDRNNRLLEVSFDFNTFGSLPHRRIPAILRVDGYELPTGFIIIENDGITESEIKLTYYSGNSNFFQTVNQLKLKDCNFGNASHLWNEDSVLNRTNPYWVYPFIEYTDMELNTYFSNVASTWSSSIEYKFPDQVTYNGSIYLCQKNSSINQQPNTNPSVWLSLPDENWYIDFRRLLPALYGNAYKDAIEKTTGYKLQGEIFNTSAWTDLIFPFSLSKLQRRKEDAKSRIDLDMYAWIGQQIPALTSYAIPLCANNNYTKYGNDNLLPYIENPPPSFTSLTNTQGHIFFPDYTISRCEFKVRISVGVSNNIKFIIQTSKMAGDVGTGNPNNPSWWDAGTNVIAGTLQGRLRHSVTNATLPLTLVGDNVLKYDGVPISYSPNPNLNYDWIAEIEFNFLTGLQLSHGIRWYATAQNYFYESFTKIRFIDYVESKDIPLYNHGICLPWFNGVEYIGNGKVFVRQQVGALIYKYKLIADRSLNEQPNLYPSKWEQLDQSNILPINLEENETDYYDVKYGGFEYECSLTTNQAHPQNAWITGSDLVPDWTVGVWLKNIANMYGCILSVDDDRRVVTFKTWKEIYDDSANAQDWSKQTINMLKSRWNTRATFGGQSSYFKYKENDKLPVDYGNYSVTIDDTTIQSEATVYQLDFSATVTEPKFEASYNAPVIPLFDLEGNMSGEDMQRVLYIYTEAIPTRAILYIGGGNRVEGSGGLLTSNIKYAYFNDGSKPKQLGWDTHLFEEYHRWLTYIWDKYRVLTCEVILNASEVAQLDLLTPVYIEYYKCYFFILKIQDWIPNKPCKVQLLKLF